MLLTGSLLWGELCPAAAAAGQIKAKVNAGQALPAGQVVLPNLNLVHSLNSLGTVPNELTNSQVPSIQAPSAQVPSAENTAAHTLAVSAIPANAQHQAAAAKPQALLPALGALEKGITDSVAGPKDAAPELGAAFDGSKVKIYLTSDGKAPVITSLSELGATFAADPSYRDGLNKRGRIRLVAAKDDPNGGLTEKDASAVEKLLRAHGVTAKVAVETIPVNWKAKPEEKTDVAGFASPKSPFGEFPYLYRSLKASFTKPTGEDLVGGAIAKALPSVLGILAWASTFLPAHPIAFAATATVGIGLNVFHGIWVNTWANFQNVLYRQRGIGYQSSFNLFYGQAWGALMRTITWAAIAKTAPIWSGEYLGTIGATTFLGTFFGVLGSTGVNILYDKGLLTRRTRSYVFWGRDLVMALGGILMGLGNGAEFHGIPAMVLFWVIFGAQQLMDLTIYLMSRRAARRPIAYAVSDKVAQTPDFEKMYPFGKADPSAFKAALMAMVGLAKAAIGLVIAAVHIVLALPLALLRGLEWLESKLRDEPKKN